jgi:hypothetical protein
MTNRLAQILQDEGLTKTATFISPKVEMTPDIQRALDAALRLWGKWGLRLEAARGSSPITLSIYSEGYISHTIRGQVGVIESPGGDRRDPYQVTPDREESVRVMVYMAVHFFDNGKVDVLLRQPKMWAIDEDEEEILYKSNRGFGPAGVKALRKAHKAFEKWEARFE